MCSGTETRYIWNLEAARAAFCARSQQNPDVNFIGVERVPEVLVMAMEKAQAAGRENLRYMNCDVRALAEAVVPGSVGRIYLNFSDPWPKDRHAKRRLTAAPFLDLYARILAPGGQLHMKTDNRNLFEYSLCELEKRGAVVTDVCYDLHASACPRQRHDRVRAEICRKEVSRFTALWQRSADMPPAAPHLVGPVPRNGANKPQALIKL